jgi:hypothetical protein
MEASLAALADDTLKGPARWYAQFHVAGCAHCSQALSMFRLLKFRLSEFAGRTSTNCERLPDERRNSLDAALDALDHDTHRTE